VSEAAVAPVDVTVETRDHVHAEAIMRALARGGPFPLCRLV
jgi:hypothetical protein